MRIPAFVALTLVAVTAFAPRPAAAAYDLPWCAFFSDSQAYSCAYRSLQECWATVLGIGGYCRPNYRYGSYPPYPPDAGPRRSKRRHPADH
ncbi:MAG TPA: DUF3551 domain-containing protein [Xanthobacteraceae bacterium]|jgi:hypothetical protein|nr:DUF3551 domain-containing protein [Xanthobacteraceae bacterium]